MIISAPTSAVAVGLDLGLAGRPGRCCRRRHRRPRPPACRPAPPRRRWCRGPTPGSGRRRAPPSTPGRPARRSDGQEAGVLALAAGVGLQRHLVVAGDLGQGPPPGRRSSLPVAGGLVGGGEGVDRRRTRATRSAPSRPPRSASSCSCRGGSSCGREPGRGRPGAAASAASRARCGSGGSWGGSGTGWSGAASCRDAGRPCVTAATPPGSPADAASPASPRPRSRSPTSLHDLVGRRLVEGDAEAVTASIGPQVHAAWP